MTEHEQAKAWRERHDLSRAQLAELTGYSYEAIYHFERGMTAPRSWAGGRRTKPQPIDPFVWHRYRTCCAGVEAKLRGEDFQW